MLLRRVDERLGLTRAAARAFGDERRSASVEHSVHSLLAQRIYDGLCLGWSDVCDHNVLRNDLVMQAAVGRAELLASAPALSRLETGATPAHAAALHEVLMQQFIASHAKAPKELVLDVDATTYRCTASRSEATSTPITTTTATCRCTSSPAKTCWRACCVPATATRPAWSVR